MQKSISDTRIQVENYPSFSKSGTTYRRAVQEKAGVDKSEVRSQNSGTTTGRETEASLRPIEKAEKGAGKKSTITSTVGFKLHGAGSLWTVWGKNSELIY